MRKFADHQPVVVFDFATDDSYPGVVLGFKPARHDQEDPVYLVQQDVQSRAFWVAESLIEPIEDNTLEDVTEVTIQTVDPVAAAAQDLLAACIAAIELSDRDIAAKGLTRTAECQAVYDQVAAAIAKAEGRGQ